MGLRAYARVLSHPGVPRLTTAAVLSRLTTSMLSLALLLAIVDVHDSYAGAGAVLTGHALGLALFAPVSGRLADRFGGRAVVLVCLGGHALAYCGLLTALGQRAPVPIVIAAAVAVGVSTPPSSSVTRTLWPRLLGGDLVRSAYALDSVVNSSMFILGPLMAGGLVVLVSPVAAVVVAGAFKIIGDLLLATMPLLRRDGGAARSTRRRRLGALTDPRIRLLLVVVSLDTFMLGCLDVGAVALAGGSGSAGLLLAALSVGEVVGGLIYGARVWRSDPRRQLIALHLVAAVVLLATGLVPAAALVGALVGALYLASGLVSGGRDALNQFVVGSYAPEAHRTETFAWLNTFMWAGFGIGTIGAGVAEEWLATSAVYLVGAVAGVAAAASVTLLRPTGGPARLLRERS